jgi:hypothetical protein
MRGGISGNAGIGGIFAGRRRTVTWNGGALSKFTSTRVHCLVLSRGAIAMRVTFVMREPLSSKSG